MVRGSKKLDMSILSSDLSLLATQSLFTAANELEKYLDKAGNFVPTFADSINDLLRLAIMSWRSVMVP